MSTQKLEYDAAMGGRVSLPSHVTTYLYAAGVLQEIRNLVADCRETTQRSSKLIFQTLPKHMRRRAMSHHPKRLPRKYRQAHKSQMGKGGNQPVNGKRPSRKYRRRPKNLMREYVRRQRRHVWLETHIWHAKRFHMVERWGHRLAFASCDKTYRACYRASAEHCLLQDISFYGCVELRGPLDTLRQGFARLTSPQCGLGVTAKTFLTGRREGSVELFEDGRYPHGALQRASFMWRPREKEEDQAEHTLWLWLHPSAAHATLKQLISVFQLKSKKQQKMPLKNEVDGHNMQVEMMEIQPEKEKLSKKERPKQEKVPTEDLGQNNESRKDSVQPALRFWTQTKAFELQPSYSNPDDTLHLVLLHRQFNRFRLTGPSAQRVLAASLRPHQQTELQDQANYCQAALQQGSPAELLSNLVMGLQVVDPRLQRPKKRTKAERNAEQTRSAGDLLVDQPKSLPESPLWSTEARELLGKGIMSTHTYEQLRQQHAVVPGAPCAFEQQMQAVPVILIQRPGSQDSRYKRLAYGCGWDVIAPAGYGMALWLTLTMWGARPGGLRELDSVAREAGAEMHLPDTIAGVQQAAAAADELRVRYFRLPPNKRTNYRKLAVASPFSAPWKQLVRDWRSSSTSASVSSYYVLRHRQQLEEIAEAIRTRRPLPEPLPEEALIQIQLRMISRGHVKNNALICLPTAADHKQRWRHIKQNDQASVHVEPAQPDLNQQLRKDLRQSHKLKLKRLRARRVREKRRLQETATKRVHIRPANTAHLVRTQLQEMCRLWLPTDPAEMRDSVRRQCSRQVFGYVSSAGFSFTEALVCAVGYVTPAGLHQLIKELPSSKGHRKQPPLMCLVRDADSRDYRWASFQINLNVACPAF
ncbi:ribonucleases P/MRP protein subunit POP1 [Drosophila rhopaloa]|uniref:Ribonucleases P/MRP protein subunit POP1 n=1 Tax=Drosophila rhopaloa TaxID=1041015 RepID=A0A6P4FGQ5_DRORH|nr:ribonucleases P/MRP protein subunit POP1 [Drosophila rhopaloa]